MSINSIVENELIQDDSSVWVLKDHDNFGYSEGTESEQYLERVFRQATDLGSQSTELECHIKDWSSEYHLTRKRAQLLAGFKFDRSLRVLEVGCGCGAITRHLGENFDQVVSVEGSLNRARLARLRTRDLESVSIICAPFQEIRFSGTFDVIFCVGVYEYSGAFIAGEDPYAAALQYFSDMLSPDGVLVIAIENQFGLKYFGGIREDHLGVFFEGLEGYHRRHREVRTFGKTELENDLKQYFSDVQFYYPYPDYKIPDCVISEEFLASGQAGELVSQMKSRDYVRAPNPLWNYASVSLELARNRMLEFFSNSFLVVAGRGALKGFAFEQLAVMFSSARKREFSTASRVVRGAGEQLMISKRSRQGLAEVKQGPLKMVDTDAAWVDSYSLQTQVNLLAMAHDRSLDEIFQPCRQWLEHLQAESSMQDGVSYVGGEHIDTIWPNVYPLANECRVVDREWVWADRIRMNCVVIRAIYDFLYKIDAMAPYSKSLSKRSGKHLIVAIGKAIGADLKDSDFAEFIRLESELQYLVFGVDKRRHALYMRWFLFDRPTLKVFLRIRSSATSFMSRMRRKLSRLV